MKGISEMREEKKRCPPAVFSFTLVRAGPCTVPGFVISTVPSIASALMVGGIAGNCSILLHGTEFGHLLGLGAEGRGEACQVHPDPDTLAAVIAHCSAGPVTSSAKDLRVQI